MAKKPEQEDLPKGAENVEEPEASVSKLLELGMLPGPTETRSNNIYQRMIIARQRMRYIKKTRHAGLQYATVNHDEVTVAAQEALDYANVLAIPTVLEHGKTGNTTWAKCSVMFINPDASEERYEVVMFGEGNDNQDKGPGKAISYTLKYCYLKALMGETGEKDADMQDLDSDPERRPESPPDPQPDPQEDEMGSAADREDLYDSLKYYAEKLEIPWPDVRAHLVKTFGNSPKLHQLKAAESSLQQDPNTWRKPEGGK